MFNIRLILLTLFLNSCALAVDLLIDQPGNYLLGDFISSSPGNADSIIKITVSNVSLDLGGFIVSQNNASTVVDGVLINDGLSDIVVQNGTISGVTRSGLRVGQSCSKITVQNVEFLNCAISGADFQGTGSTAIADGAINNCLFYNCGTTSGGAPLNLLSCSNFSVNNCTIANSSLNVTWTGALLSTCSQCTFQTLIIKGNTGANTLTGIGVNGGSSNNFINCLVETNSAGSNMIAYNFASSTTANTINNCIALNNTSTAGSFIGFNLNSAVFSYLNKCTVAANTALGINAFFFDNGANNNLLTSCLVQSNSNTSLSSSFTGYGIAAASFGLLLDCTAAYNSSSGPAQGIALSGATASKWVFSSPLVMQNIGSSVANSFGIVYSVTAPVGTLLFRTIAFNNSTTARNQIIAPANYTPTGSITNPGSLPPTSNLNTITGVWTNIAIQN